jgi:hypothetical protein
VRQRLVPAAAALVASLAAVLSTGTAHAQKPVSRTSEYSPYEKETIQRALDALGLAIDPAPEDKTIRRIDTVRLEVLEDRDPIPEDVAGLKVRKILNSLHYTSRDFVIRREMLLHEGDRYLQVVVDETARNMRSRMPLQVSLVIILPVRTGEADTVDLLVITKDIWSLRLSFDMSVTPGGVENFVLVPQETNLLGRHHTLQTRFQYQPETYTLGAGYRIPRFGYSWIGASASAAIIINRRRGEPEGSSMGVTVGQGLYSTRTPWAWSADAGYTVGVVRRYLNAAVLPFNAVSTPGIDDRIPYQYRSRSMSAQAGVTRSFGWGLKNNFSLTMNASTAEYDTFDLSPYAPAAASEVRARALPRGEARVYPALSWSTFTNDFLRTLDIQTLALQEDYRLGHDVSISVYPVTRALGSSRTFIGVSGKVGYALAMGDGLAGASVSTFAENQDGIITDGSVSGSFGAVTPRLGFGRLVMNTSFSNRYKNYLNARSFAGGDDRLRGYPTNYFFGKDTIFYNVEFRSRSIEILKAQLGGVLFFDAGDAAQGFDMLRAKQSLGFGLRALFPQLNRLVFRADFAFPMKRGPFPETGIATPVDPFGFYFAFDQAFNP